MIPGPAVVSTLSFGPSFGYPSEGLAVKFCNNAEGVVSKRLEPELEPNLGVPSIPLLNQHFEEHFQLFCDTVRRIQAGTFAREEMERQQMEFWMNPYLYGGEPLDQLAIYSFGNELYGCVCDHFGLDAAYGCVRHPARLISYFNRAGCGWLIPESGTEI